MAKYTDADCKLCRREGAKLFLKGDRCVSKKCAIEKRPTPPGPHGPSRRKPSEYSIQLREKQKTKRMYGLLEKQFRGYYEEAERMRGVTGEIMLSLLERRLDNVIYRMGLGASRAQARQIVNHGHIEVNGRRVDIPGFQVRTGDVLTVREGKRDNTLFKELRGAKIVMPKWLEFDTERFVGKILELPKREDIDLGIKEQLIIELYSK
ncbi:MAG: 30S ribosomal protein S4 [Clostridiales bacterium]|jgi:small subunit ribosomal protein S4|nr:30S ribosomal protein S4 [Clostridiales bacterium]